MNLVLASVFIIFIWQIRFRKINFSNYMSLEQTSAINGFFVMLVFLRHFGQYISCGPCDKIFRSLDNKLGQLIVTTFLFYSGYGIMYSIVHKMDYLKTIPRRFLRILIQFDVAIVLFIITDLWLGKKLTISKILLAFIGWESIGNSNWYIFAVLCLYVITYIAGKISNNNYNLLILSVIIGCCFYALLLYLTGKPIYYYDTIFCYPVGMVYSLYFEKINNFLEKKKMNLLLNGAGAFAICVVSHIAQKRIDNNFLQYVLVSTKNVSFAWVIIALTTVFIIANPVLSWLGGYVFEIYILQRIPMAVFMNAIQNKYIYLAICWIVTIMLAIVFKKVELYLNKILTDLFNKSEKLFRIQYGE